MVPSEKPILKETERNTRIRLQNFSIVLLKAKESHSLAFLCALFLWQFKTILKSKDHQKKAVKLHWITKWITKWITNLQ